MNHPKLLLTLGLLTPLLYYAQRAVPGSPFIVFGNNTSAAVSGSGEEAACSITLSCCGEETCVDASCCDSCFCASTLIPRSADSNTALLWGLPFMHLESMRQVYTGQMLAFEYQQTFNSKNLAKCLFGTNQLLFQGSQVPDRSATALIADNFGLSQTFDGAISLKPVIQNFNLHYVGCIGFDSWAPGLWAKLDCTFSHQQRSLICGTSLVTTDTTSFPPFPASYMEIGSPVEPAQSMCDALSGNFLFGDMQTPWFFGKWSFCTQKADAVAGLSLNIGYDFYNKNSSYLGAFFRFSAPTGTKSGQKYIFDTVVGNGKYWELGGGLCVRHELWNNHDRQHLSLLLDGYVTTLLPSHHIRTFDFNNTTTAFFQTTAASVIANGQAITIDAPHCLSRYVLLKQLEVQTPTGGNESSYAYAGSLMNAINFTTRNTRVKINVKGDATLKMVFTSGGFDLGLGYNIYGQSREKITRLGAACAPGSENTFGIKGCNGVGYNQYATDGTSITENATSTALNATYRYANAYACHGVTPGTDEPALSQDGTPVAIESSDVFEATWDSNNNNSDIQVGAFVANLTPNQIVPAISVDPYLLSDNDLDICSGTAPRQFSNKGFISFDYTWVDRKLSPWIGCAAEIEGGSRNCDVAQWGCWVRVGLSY